MWSVSTDEETYQGTFDTVEDAVREGNECGQPFWVGQCVPPVPPEDLFDGWAIERWLNTTVYDHVDYMGEWAEFAVAASREQRDELAASIRPVIAAWLDRHNLRPKHFVINPDSVRRFDPGNL